MSEVVTPGIENRLHSEAGRSPELGRLMAKATKASDFLKALSHPSRLLVLCLLSEGERSVTELETALSLRQPTVSQQLARLRSDGLVETRRDGKTIFYRLANDDAREVIEVIYQIFCRPDRRADRA